MNREERRIYLQSHKEQIIANLKKHTDYERQMFKNINEYNEKIEAELQANEKTNIEFELSDYNIEPTGDKEEVCGIDLKPYLEEIRHLEDHEELLVLYIKNGKIAKKEKIKGGSMHVTYSKEDEEKIFAKAKNIGANIYMIHNHPLSAYAKLSKGDIRGYNMLTKKIAKKYNVNVIGYGVVTEDDYCTLKEL